MFVGDDVTLMSPSRDGELLKQLEAMFERADHDVDKFNTRMMVTTSIYLHKLTQ